MKNYPDYRKATNAAYQLLAKRQSLSLTTNVFSIGEDLVENCVLITYGQACFLYGYTLQLLFRVSEFGFSIIKGNKRIIFYNEAAPMGSILFTIAHEIGHAVLSHTDEHDAASEKEANCFARNLLCPIPVVCGLGLKAADDYVSVFSITGSMAAVAFDKRDVDRYYIKDELFQVVSDMLDAYMMEFDDVDEYYRYFAS